MFFFIVIIFGVCWLPYHVYFLYAYHDKSIVNKPYIQHVYLGFYWLAMSNTMVNPIIYYWMNVRWVTYKLSIYVSSRDIPQQCINFNLKFSFPFRFRKYFLKVLLFVPRLVCRKQMDKVWEDMEGMELKHMHTNGSQNAMILRSRSCNNAEFPRSRLGASLVSPCHYQFLVNLKMNASVGLRFGPSN